MAIIENPTGKTQLALAYAYEWETRQSADRTLGQ